MKRLVSFALAVALAAAAAPSAQQRSANLPRVRVAYLFSDGNISGTLKAYKALLRERPDLRDRVAITFLTESMLADANIAEVTAAQVLVLDIMNQQMLERFNAEKKLDLIAAVRRRGTVLAVGEGLLPKEHYIKQGAVWDDRARTYWGHGGQSNQVGLLKYALTQAGIRGLTLPAPQRSMDFGYYYPVADAKSGGYRGEGQAFASWEEFTAWKQTAGKSKPGAPRVAVGVYKSNFYGGET